MCRHGRVASVGVEGAGGLRSWPGALPRGIRGTRFRGPCGLIGDCISRQPNRIRSTPKPRLAPSLAGKATQPKSADGGIEDDAGVVRGAKRCSQGAHGGHQHPGSLIVAGPEQERDRLESSRSCRAPSSRPVSNYVRTWLAWTTPRGDQARAASRGLRVPRRSAPSAGKHDLDQRRARPGRGGCGEDPQAFAIGSETTAALLVCLQRHPRQSCTLKPPSPGSCAHHSYPGLLAGHGDTTPATPRRRRIVFGQKSTLPVATVHGERKDSMSHGRGSLQARDHPLPEALPRPGGVSFTQLGYIATMRP